MTETTTPAPALPLTEAQRYLADNRDRLELLVESRKAAYTLAAEGMTIAEIRVAIDAHNAAVTSTYDKARVPTKTAPKGDYVTALVTAQMRTAPETQDLRDVTSAAYGDDALDMQMRSLQARRDTVLAKTAEALAAAATDPAKAGYDLLYHLEWHADDDMTALAAARLADGYLDARARGIEPSAYARHLAQQAIAKIVRTVDGGSNLRLTSRGLHDLCEANAHRIALGKVLGHLDEATQELIGYVL